MIIPMTCMYYITKEVKMENLVDYSLQYGILIETNKNFDWYYITNNWDTDMVYCDKDCTTINNFYDLLKI